MAITYSCPSCGRLLRVPDEAAGRLARCPACGRTSEAVPSPPNEAPPAFNTSSHPPARDEQNPFAPAGAEAPPRPTSDNPYQAPSVASTASLAPRGPLPRTGPPWESEGPSWQSFWATVGQGFAQPTLLFASMHPTRGLALPLAMSALCVGCGSVVFWGLQIGMQVVMMAFAGVGGAAAGGGDSMFLTGFVLGLFGMALLYWVFLGVLWPVCASLVYHPLLLLLRGAQFGFVATLRAMYYTNAFTGLLMLIPFCGNHIYGVVFTVYATIALCYLHDAPAWKPLLAVLLPLLLCLGGVFLLVVASIASGF